MKVLAINTNCHYCSETVIYNKRRFKITVENGNSYFHLRIFMYCQSGLAAIAGDEDIQGAEYIGYYEKEEVRLKKGIDNMKIAEEYIKLIF